jgi:hypothetical protein
MQKPAGLRARGSQIEGLIRSAYVNISQGPNNSELRGKPMQKETILKELHFFPKIKSELPEAYKLVFEKEYKDNREGVTLMSRLAQFLEGWMHKKVSQKSGGPLLEIGAGTLNHLAFENSIHDYDICEPYTFLFKDNPNKEKIRHVYHTFEDIPVDQKFQRIISIAVLEHLHNLPLILARSALMLDKDGVFQAGIPSEGGLLWWLSWRFSTGLAYRLRTGLDYGVVMRHEHVNTQFEIIKWIKLVFKDVKTSRFPLPSAHLSLYGYIEARNPKTENVQYILNNYSKET